MALQALKLSALEIRLFAKKIRQSESILGIRGHEDT